MYRLGIGVVLAMCAMTGVAYAQDAGPTADADAQARAYYKVGAFDSAAAEFLAAYEQDKRPSYLFNAALSFEKAELLAQAAQAYERYLSEQPTGDKAVEARARLVAVKNALAEKKQQQIDEAAANELAAKVTAIAEQARKHNAAGLHAEAAEAFAEAYALTKDPEFLFDQAEAERSHGDSERAMTSYQEYLRSAPDGARHSLAERRLGELDKASAMQRVPTAAIASRPEDSTSSPGMSGRRKLAIGLGAVGAVGLVGGSVFAVRAVGQKDDALNPSIGACDEDFTVCNARGAQLFDDAKTSALLADMGFGLGTITGAVAVYLWLSDDSGESQKASNLGLQLSPRVGSRTVGLALEGGF